MSGATSSLSHPALPGALRNSPQPHPPPRHATAKSHPSAAGRGRGLCTGSPGAFWDRSVPSPPLPGGVSGPSRKRLELRFPASPVERGNPEVSGGGGQRGAPRWNLAGCFLATGEVRSRRGEWEPRFSPLPGARSTMRPAIFPLLLDPGCLLLLLLVS